MACFLSRSICSGSGYQDRRDEAEKFVFQMKGDPVNLGILPVIKRTPARDHAVDPAGDSKRNQNHHDQQDQKHPPLRMTPLAKPHPANQAVPATAPGPSDGRAEQMHRHTGHVEAPKMTSVKPNKTDVSTHRQHHG